MSGIKGRKSIESKLEKNKIMNRVKGKTIIVTGGAVGIGRAISLILAQEGAKVAVTDLQDEAGHKVVEEITEAGGSAAFWHMDVSSESEVKRMFARIVENFGGIDVLVNNAGISGTNKPTHEITCEEWDQVIAVNVKGVFLYAKEKIRVNSVHPGFIWTPLVEELGERSDEGVEKFRENLDSLHPIGHVGEPEDIAWGVVYLASDELKFVTGSELVIDGGYTAR